MDTKYLFYITLVISIAVQIITGIIEIGAFFVKVPTFYSLIKQLLIIELVVQFFEGTFYFWLAYNFTKVLNVTPKRYIDWVITTPSMLITLMVYLIYLNQRESKDSSWSMKLFPGVNKRVKNKINELNLFTILKENLNIFIPVVLLNWLMLLFGYLGEMKIIPLLLGVFLGFMSFLIYYYIIYVNYVTQNASEQLLFWYFFFFWSLYGVVAILPYYIKNSFYNILDLFSKNFFGIFLSYIIFFEKY
jgi:bacteriorhodopsin